MKHPTQHCTVQFSLPAILLCSLLAFLVLPARAQQEISVARFGAIPGDTVNDRAAIQQAIDYCRQRNIQRLIIPPGVYRIADTAATRLMQDAYSGKLGRNPETIVFTPYYPYSRGVHFKGIKKLEVEASGAFFMAEGWMEPVSIEYSTDISIKGLTIDYSDPPHSEGKIIFTGSTFFDIEFPEPRDTKSPLLITRIMFWDHAKNRLWGSTIYFPGKQQWLSSTVLRIWAKPDHAVTGNTALLNHCMHFRPAILVHESTNTVLERVTIHSQPGMGIVGHRSTNILMKGLRIVPRSGYYQSTNTDATHFTSCKGTIRFDGCIFEGHGDDATNVHAYYHDITGKTGPFTYSIQLDKKFTTHAAVLDFPDKGDTLELISKKTLQVAGVFTVVKTDTFPRQWKSHVHLNKPLPDDIENYYLTDISRIPRLEFVNSYVGSHLARAVLVKTRNVLIENNVFRESTGTAVHIGAEGDWREGPGSANIIIRNNRFIRCGRGDGTQNNASAIAINVRAPDVSKAGIHKNILIDGNIIEGEPGYSQYGIFITGADKVRVNNNEFANCTIPWQVQYSTNVTFSNNHIYEKKAITSPR